MILQQLNSHIYLNKCCHTYQIYHAPNVALIWGRCFLRAVFIWKLDTAKSCINNSNIISYIKLTELMSFDYIRAKVLIWRRRLIWGIWVNMIYGKYISLHYTEVTAITVYLLCLKEKLPPIWSDKSKYKGFLDIICSSTSQSMVNS